MSKTSITSDHLPEHTHAQDIRLGRMCFLRQPIKNEVEQDWVRLPVILPYVLT